MAYRAAKTSPTKVNHKGQQEEQERKINWFRQNRATANSDERARATDRPFPRRGSRLFFSRSVTRNGRVYDELLLSAATEGRGVVWIRNTSPTVVA